MGGVAERAEVRIVRRHDHGPASRRKQPVKLFHCADYIRDMFDDVNSPHLAKNAIAKRKRIVVKISNDVRACVRVPIHAN